MVGVLRPAQGWVGGTSPHDAVYVPPPPAEIPRLMEDLVQFADAADDLDAVSRAAIAHAQFEAIHPYGDGNGRLGRVLVSRILRRDSAARVLLAHLAGHPVVNSADVAGLLGVSERTGRTALETLAEHSVLTEIEVRTGQVGRARRWYAAESLIRLWGPTGR